MGLEKEDGKFKLDLDIKTGNAETDYYIYQLHSYIISWETSSIKSLIVALDRLAQKLCDDVDFIVDGEIEKLTVLSPDSQDKSFERLMVLVSKIKEFKAISELAESLRPEIKERKSEVESSKPKIKEIDLGDNPFEALQGLKMKTK